MSCSHLISLALILAVWTSRVHADSITSVTLCKSTCSSNSNGATCDDPSTQVTYTTSLNSCNNHRGTVVDGAGTYWSFQSFRLVNNTANHVNIQFFKFSGCGELIGPSPRPSLNACNPYFWQINDVNHTYSNIIVATGPSSPTSDPTSSPTSDPSSSPTSDPSGPSLGVTLCKSTCSSNSNGAQCDDPSTQVTYNPSLNACNNDRGTVMDASGTYWSFTSFRLVNNTANHVNIQFFKFPNCVELIGPSPAPTLDTCNPYFWQINDVNHTYSYVIVTPESSSPTSSVPTSGPTSGPTSIPSGPPLDLTLCKSTCSSTSNGGQCDDPSTQVTYNTALNACNNDRGMVVDASGTYWSFLSFRLVNDAANRVNIQFFKFPDCVELIGPSPTPSLDTCNPYFWQILDVNHTYSYVIVTPGSSSPSSSPSTGPTSPPSTGPSSSPSGPQLGMTLCKSTCSANSGTAHCDDPSTQVTYNTSLNTCNNDRGTVMDASGTYWSFTSFRLVNNTANHVNIQFFKFPNCVELIGPSPTPALDTCNPYFWQINDVNHTYSYVIVTPESSSPTSGPSSIPTPIPSGPPLDLTLCKSTCSSNSHGAQCDDPSAQVTYNTSLNACNNDRGLVVDASGTYWGFLSFRLVNDTANHVNIQFFKFPNCVELIGPSPTPSLDTCNPYFWQILDVNHTYSYVIVTPGSSSPTSSPSTGPTFSPTSTPTSSPSGRSLGVALCKSTCSATFGIAHCDDPSTQVTYNTSLNTCNNDRGTVMDAAGTYWSFTSFRLVNRTANHVNIQFFKFPDCSEQIGPSPAPTLDTCNPYFWQINDSNHTYSYVIVTPESFLGSASSNFNNLSYVGIMISLILLFVF